MKYSNMKIFLQQIVNRVLVNLGLRPSDEELELDRICESENQKIYKQFKIDIEAISKEYKFEE